MKCELCGEVTTFIGLSKDHNYHKWMQMILTDPTIHYEHCETCKLMTRQTLIAFDLEGE